LPLWRRAVRPGRDVLASAQPDRRRRLLLPWAGRGHADHGGAVDSHAGAAPSAGGARGGRRRGAGRTRARSRGPSVRPTARCEAGRPTTGHDAPGRCPASHGQALSSRKTGPAPRRAHGRRRARRRGRRGGRTSKCRLRRGTASTGSLQRTAPPAHHPPHPTSPPRTEATPNPALTRGRIRPGDEPKQIT